MSYFIPRLCVIISISLIPLSAFADAADPQNPVGESKAEGSVQQISVEKKHRIEGFGGVLQPSEIYGRSRSACPALGFNYGYPFPASNIPHVSFSVGGSVLLTLCIFEEGAYDYRPFDTLITRGEFLVEFFDRRIFLGPLAGFYFVSTDSTRYSDANDFRMPQMGLGLVAGAKVGARFWFNEHKMYVAPALEATLLSAPYMKTAAPGSHWQAGFTLAFGGLAR